MQKALTFFTKTVLAHRWRKWCSWLSVVKGSFCVFWCCTLQSWCVLTEAEPDPGSVVFTAVRSWQSVKRRPADLCICLPFIVCFHWDWDWDYISFHEPAQHLGLIKLKTYREMGHFRFCIHACSFWFLDLTILYKSLGPKHKNIDI